MPQVRIGCAGSKGSSPKGDDEHSKHGYHSAGVVLRPTDTSEAEVRWRGGSSPQRFAFVFGGLTRFTPRPADGAKALLDCREPWATRQPQKTSIFSTGVDFKQGEIIPPAAKGKKHEGTNDSHSPPSHDAGVRSTVSSSRSCGPATAPCPVPRVLRGPLRMVAASPESPRRMCGVWWSMKYPLRNPGSRAQRIQRHNRLSGCVRRMDQCVSRMPQ